MDRTNLIPHFCFCFCYLFFISLFQADYIKSQIEYTDCAVALKDAHLFSPMIYSFFFLDWFAFIFHLFFFLLKMKSKYVNMRRRRRRRSQMWILIRLVFLHADHYNILLPASTAAVYYTFEELCDN